MLCEKYVPLLSERRNSPHTLRDTPLYVYTHVGLFMNTIVSFSVRLSYSADFMLEEFTNIVCTKLLKKGNVSRPNTPLRHYFLLLFDLCVFK
jgi:hypothetical protein